MYIIDTCRDSGCRDVVYLTRALEVNLICSSITRCLYFEVADPPGIAQGAHSGYADLASSPSHWVANNQITYAPLT